MGTNSCEKWGSDDWGNLSLIYKYICWDNVFSCRNTHIYLYMHIYIYGYDMICLNWHFDWPKRLTVSRCK